MATTLAASAFVRSFDLLVIFLSFYTVDVFKARITFVLKNIAYTDNYDSQGTTESANLRTELINDVSV